MNQLKKLRDFTEKEVDRSILEIEKQYNLSVSELPSLYKVKNVHQNLLTAYVKIISVATNLDFFVLIHPARKVKTGTLFKKIFAIVFYRSLFRLITLRPLVVLFVEMHVYKKLNLLEAIYTQMSYLTPNNPSERNDYLKWVNLARAECQELKASISSANNIKNSVKSLGVYLVGIFFTVFGVSTLNELIVKLMNDGISPTIIPSLIKLTIILFILYLYGSIFIENAFETKRSIFLKTELFGNQNKSCYKLEYELFNLIGRKKPNEFAWDLFISTLDSLFRILLMSVIAYIATQATQIQVYPLIIFGLWSIVMLLIVMMISSQILPWIKRIRDNET